MRHHHTNRSAARAARVLAAALAAALSSHCTEPNPAPGPDGHWTLIAVDGSPLPAMIRPDEMMLAGDLDLLGDGTYVKRATVSVTGVVFHGTTFGRWSARGDQIEFRPSTGTVQVGQWRDRAIEIQDVLTTRYVPAAAAVSSPRNASPPVAPGGAPPERRRHFSVSSTPAGSVRP